MSEPVYGIPYPIDYGPVFSSLADVPTNWGMALCNVDALRQAGGDGEGEVVAILDTGIDPNHPEFAGRVGATRSFVAGEQVYDGNGHGTHCAGTAAGGSKQVGVANKAKILAGKCLANSGSGGSGGIHNAVKWAADNGATVISMSIGGPGFLEGIEELLRQVIAAGIVPVVAAGNERGQGGVVTFPSSAIVVAAVGPDGRYANFSNPASTGLILSAATPGVNIPSAKPGGGYQQMSGTSMATPFLAGGIAALQSGRVKKGLPRLTTSQVKSLLTARSVDAGDPGPDRNYGPGVPDFNSFALSLVPNPVVQ